jgi:hypothetical protein
MNEKKYVAKIFGRVHVLPGVDYDYDNICCSDLKDAIMQNRIGIELNKRKFHINAEESDGIWINYCPFCNTKLEVIETNNYIDTDDDNIIWERKIK